MKAWLFTAAHEPMQLIERETPQPGPGEVIVAVKAAGLCHSDCGFLDGTLTSLLTNLPMILGHEVAGTIDVVGEGVTDFAPGDRVVVAGPEHFMPGWAVDGGYATHCLAKADGLLRLPDNVSFAQGAAATDAGMTSYGAIMGTGELKPGQRIGIVGLGGLGMTGARIAVLNGAAEVYAAEPRRDAWDVALRNGVKQVFADVLELAPLELDLIVDFAGFGSTTSGAILAVKAGGMVVQVGLGVNEATISTTALTGKAVTLRGSRGGMMPGATAAVIAHMAAGDLEIAASTVGFDEIPEALDRLHHGGVVGRLVATPA